MLKNSFSIKSIHSLQNYRIKKFPNETAKLYSGTKHSGKRKRERDREIFGVCALASFLHYSSAEYRPSSPYVRTYVRTPVNYDAFSSIVRCSTVISRPRPPNVSSPRGHYFRRSARADSRPKISGRVVDA